MKNLEKIYEILEEILPNIDVRNEDDLVGKGYLESFTIMQLIVKLSEEFDIEISPVLIVPENFKSAEALAKMVEKLED